MTKVETVVVEGGKQGNRNPYNYPKTTTVKTGVTEDEPKSREGCGNIDQET